MHSSLSRFVSIGPWQQREDGGPVNKTAVLLGRMVLQLGIVRAADLYAQVAPRGLSRAAFDTAIEQLAWAGAIYWSDRQPGYLVWAGPYNKPIQWKKGSPV